jgi:hypothetical protein
MRAKIVVSPLLKHLAAVVTLLFLPTGAFRAGWKQAG